MSVEQQKEFINQHRHTPTAKDNEWGDVDCTETIDFGTGAAERELTCRVCDASMPYAESMAKVISPYHNNCPDNKYGV